MNDMRNFGTLSIFKNIEQLQKKLDKIGPDIFYITENQFVEIIKSAPSAKIGEFLMKQQKIAGIGNYLRADILWLSKISPFRKIKDLTLQEIKTIFINSQKLIWYFYDYKQGIKDKIISKTDKFPIDYNRDFFAYGEKKDIHGNEIKTDTLGSRTIHYVPDYQK
jgi:formamidopyrimidine-DNA glycosylase